MQPEDSDQGSASSRDSLSRLVKLAATPDEPSAEATARAYEAALRSWLGTATPIQKHRSRGMQWAAVAAIVLVLVAMGFWLGRPYGTAAPPSVAQIVNAQGITDMSSVEAAKVMAGSPVPVLAGTTLRTQQGMLALQVGEVLSVRVNQHTELRLDEPDDMTLIQGSVYVDTGGVNAATTLRVHTPAGDVRHLGTQFQIVVNGADTRISVREGRVLLESPTMREEVGSGELLHVDSAGGLSREEIPAFGPNWQWVANIAHPMNIENRPLIEFLTWMAREQGWTLRFASPDDEQLAQSIRLHGSLATLQSQEMLERISLITGVAMESQEGVLIVGGNTSGDAQ